MCAASSESRSRTPSATVWADGILDLGERCEVELAAEQFDKARAQVGIERLDQVTGVGLVQLADQRLQGYGVAAFDGLPHVVEEFSADPAVVVTEGGSRRGPGHVSLIDHAGLAVASVWDEKDGAFVRPVFTTGKSRGTIWSTAIFNRALSPPPSSDHVRTEATMIRILLLLSLTLLALPPSQSAAADCPGNPAALGTERVLAIDPAQTASVGRKQFPRTLPLASKEIVLTFDDGPWPGTTDRVLDALKHECVRATFFMLGRNAAAHSALAKRVLAEGHTVAHHTYKHSLLNRMPVERAEAEINRGIAAVEAAAYGEPGGPGFASSPALLDRLKARGIAVFGADLWAGDWNPMTPQHEHALLLRRLTKAGRGILLLHDIQPKTAAMLPGLLRELKRRDYRMVHIVPLDAR
jgi:peptidoglycan/xylan/chitin deacetylase (PgdA/CDA1 family)